MINNNDITNIIKESDIAFNKGDYIVALELLESTLSKDITNVETNYRIGIILTKIKEYNQAIKHFNVIIENQYKFIHLPHVLTMKGFAQSQINDFKGAKNSLIESLKYDGNNLKALSILSFIHYRAKEYDIALRIYDKILEIDPDNDNALNSKGFILIETGQNIDDGLELCKKAYEINPNSPSVLDSIGWGYYKKGDLENSALYIKRAFELMPQSKEIKAHLVKIIS